MHLVYCIGLYAIIFCGIGLNGDILVHMAAVPHVINIKKTGNNTPECKKNPSFACATLDYVLQGGKEIQNNTEIRIFPGKHSLVNDTSFESVKDFKIVGVEGKRSEIVIACANTTDVETRVGFRFVRSSDITLEGITVQNCGAKRNSTTKQQRYLRAAFYFAFCRNIHMSSVSFIKNYGIAINMYDVSGLVNFTDAHFERNYEKTEHFYRIGSKLPKANTARQTDASYLTSGGGVYIEFTLCGALDPFNCSHEKEQQQYNRNSTYIFKYCNFSQNYAEHYSTSPVQPSNTSHINFGRGGGLSVFFKGEATQNKFLLERCEFERNIALWGGGCFVEFLDKSQSNSFGVRHSKFKENVATFEGGGARIGSFYDDQKLLLKENFVEFHHCDFWSNRAIWGGGASIAGTTRIYPYFNNDMSRSVKFNNCNFLKNGATVGSAVGFATKNLNENSLGPGQSYKVYFIDCIIEENKIIFTEDGKVIGQGALYSEEVSLHFSNITFKKNNGTAVVLDSSSLLLTGNAIFYENSGLEGGGIALYGHSWIMLRERSKLLFIRNIAERKGGAIYVKAPGPSRLAFQTTELQTSRCFFRYQDDHADFDPNKWDCSVEFINNTAPLATGNSVYASTLQYCRLYQEKRNSTTALDWATFHYQSVGNGQPEVVTEAIDIEFDKTEWHVPPTLRFSPDINITDEKRNSVYGSIKILISTQNQNNVELDPPSSLFLVKDKIPGIHLKGTVGDPYNVSFLTTTGQTVKTPEYQTYLDLCPPGYIQMPGKNECQCNDEVIKNSGVVRCDNKDIYLLKGRWGGVDSKEHFYTRNCPPNYCICYNSKNDVKKKNEEDDYECLYPGHDHENKQCAQNRVGTLCGQCREGYSVLLGSEDCDICPNIWLLLIIPIVVAASIFVLIVMYFNIDAFSGYLNAFLYAYQSLPLLLTENSKLDPFIQMIIGVVGLYGTGGQFGVCLFNGFDDLHKLGFNLAIPFYIILFTLIIGLCLPERAWNKLFGNSTRSNSFGRAFSFVYVICYTAFTSKTLSLFHPVKIENKLYLYQAAHVRFFHGKHLPYAIPALLILLFVVIGFPVILLFTPFFTERFQFISRMEPVFNTLKNCFQSPLDGRVHRDYRPFAAFYFICRFVLIMIGIFIADEIPKLVLIALSCVIFQVIFTWFQPYRVWTMNFWDTLLLTDLCAISLLSIILSVPYIIDKNLRDGLKIVIHILAYVPLLSIIARTAVLLYNKCKCKGQLGSFDGKI